MRCRSECLLLVIFLLTGSVFAGSYVTYGEVDVKVFVVLLDGVDAYGVDNVSRAVDGALAAARIMDEHGIHWIINPPPLPPGTVGRILLNVNCSIVNDWEMYRDIVETGSNIIIVNIHGGTLPVPGNYEKEAWVDKIAEAMLFRNVTWVHTAVYPFYYYQRQGGEWGEWGEDGFKRLMSHIGKENVTCKSPGNYKVYLHIGYPGNTMFDDFSYLACYAEVGYPLNASMFRDRGLIPIWGCEDTYLTGALLRFNKPDDPNGFGFYVHIGTRKTFDSDKVETDGDYVRANIGTSVAIYANAFKQIDEQLIQKAENAIKKAENEGRTVGLNDPCYYSNTTAKQLLQMAKEAYNELGFQIVVEYAESIIRVAERARKPSFIEAYAEHLTILSIMGGLLATFIIIKQVNNRRRKVDEKG